VNQNETAPKVPSRLEVVLLAVEKQPGRLHSAVIPTRVPAMPDSPVITLYSSAICPYCVAAKNFLKSRGRNWVEVRVDTDPSQRAVMLARSHRTSVPQIFIGEVHVGGYEELVALDRRGGLQPLLEGVA
jgi:glutaredoxin 3